MNDKVKKPLPGNLNKSELELLLEAVPKEQRNELLKKKIEEDTKPGISDELRKKIKELSKKRLKRKYKKGDVISGGKVLPTMEAAKGGEVKGYKHGGSVKAGRLAKRGYGAAKK